MALATQCPHCGKRFRVAADQLKLRGGIVRCGACHEIFDGNATLIDLDALGEQADSASAAPASATPVEPVVPAKAGTHTEPAGTPPDPAAFVPKDSDLDGEPIFTLDFDHAFDPLGTLPKVEPVDEAQPAAGAEPEAAAPEAKPEPAAPEEQPASGEPAPAGPGFDLPVDEELVAAPLPGHDHDDGPTLEHSAQARALLHTPSPGEPLPMRESAPGDLFTEPAQPRIPPRAKAADGRPGRRSKLTPTKIAAPKLRVPDIDEPEFVRRSRQQEQSGKTRRLVMAAGSAVLLVVLAAQAVTTFRNTLAARYPAAKPALAATCALLGCRIELPAQIDNLTIEQGELTTLAANNTYSLSTLLHNQGSLVQAWPHIELTLTDTNDKPLLRRVFTPAEYLAQGAAPATGFAARAEQPVRLYFQLDQLKPSGYRIAVFYP